MSSCPSVASATKQMQLRWSTHHGTILANFDALFKSESLVDVMLTADGKFIKAHRILLSACSPYFEDMFKQMEGEKYPVVYLKDVKYTELESIIHFMYHGEVKISQEDLPSLLQVAKGLRIRGLSSDQPPPPPSSKLIPLQALMTIESTESIKSPVSVFTTSSSSASQGVSSGQFTNNLTAETPIRIVNCNSLATTSAANFSLQIAPPISQSSVRPVTLGQVKTSTILTPTTTSSPVTLQIPINSEGSSDPLGGISITSPRVRPTVQRKIAKQIPENSKRRQKTPIILGTKGAVFSFPTPPMRSIGGPPILFPEVTTPELKPKFQYIKTKPRLSKAVAELQEEETEMMTSTNEMSGDAHSNHELSSASWSYVEPEKLAGIKFSRPLDDSTSFDTGLKRLTPRRRIGRPRARRGSSLKHQRGRGGTHKNAPTSPVN